MTQPSSTQPNVIVVFTDQQRWDTTGVHGNPLGLTPNFDRIARAGLHAELAFTSNPVCGPARSALQTGRYPTSNGCYRNGIALPPQDRTLAHAFGDAGYHTGYIGKWHLADSDPVPPEQRGGYRTWLASNTLEFTSDAYKTVVYDDDANPVFLPGYRSDGLFDAAIRFAADHRAEPFYLFLSLIEPHHQNEVDSYPAPTGYEERYQGRWMPPDLAALSAEGGTAHRHLGGYLGQIRRVDEGLGRLLDALQSMDLLDSTIVAYTSDHGSHFKTRNSEYKRSCHDASIRVPLAVCGPGFSTGPASASRVAVPVSTLDLPPTLLEAAGLDVPEDMQGISLLAGDRPGEVFVQVSESEVGRALRTSRWLYYVVDQEADGVADAHGTHYVETALYDLDRDPHQLDNLVGMASHRGLADDLRDRLVARMTAVGEAEPVIEPAPERITVQRRVDPVVHGFDLSTVRFGHEGSAGRRVAEPR